MPPLQARTSAADAIDKFDRYLADRQLASSTRRIRRHFLAEYLRHVQQAAGSTGITVADLMGPARTDAWLTDAASGKTRTRNTLRGPEAAAGQNSMRVRIDSYNAFAQFLGLADRRGSQPPARGFCLTPADTERLLHDLTVRRPVHAYAATSLRTAAVAALVADTGFGVPELAPLSLDALHLNDEARVELDGGPYPLGGPAVQILTRWLAARAAIIAELEGSDPGHLWIPIKPGRPRGGRPPVKPGIAPAAVRTLHAAHRTLVSRLLGTPLRPGALRGVSTVTINIRPCAVRPGSPRCCGSAAHWLTLRRTPRSPEDAVIRHFTASGVVLHEGSVLLVEHRKLRWWMPPGGHLDPNEDPVQAVLREVAEETGLACEVITSTPFQHDAVVVLPAPFTILVEDIPEDDGTNHQHIDFTYVLRPVSDPAAVSAQEGEVTGVRWVPLDQVGVLSTPPELTALVSAAVEYAAALTAV